VLDWLEKHGEVFLRKNVGIGRNLQKARLYQKSHETFEGVVQVIFNFLMDPDLISEKKTSIVMFNSVLVAKPHRFVQITLREDKLTRLRVSYLGITIPKLNKLFTLMLLRLRNTVIARNRF
jgi:hypothetical protein